jgi:hypothetical protein
MRLLGELLSSRWRNFKANSYHFDGREPIITEQPGMPMTVEHRHGLGGNDEG